MKKTLVACLSVILLLCSSLAFANLDLKGKYLGAHFNPAGKPIALTKNSLYATEILVLNNTSDSITVEVPYTDIYDWVSGNSVYRITSYIYFPSTNVRIWHPDFGYIDSYVSSFSIVSFSIQYSHAHILTVEYH